MRLPNLDIVIPLALLFIQGGCAASGLREAANDEWYLVYTPRFEVRTNVGKEEARLVGRDLEDIYRALGTSPWLGGSPSSYHCMVIALDGNHVLGEVSERVAGYFTDRPPFGPTVVSSYSKSAWENPTLKHEIAHSYQHSFAYWMPLWLTEGVATYVETAEYDRETNLAVFGVPPPDWVLGQRLRGRQLLEAAGYHNAERESYTSGALLVHFLASEYPHELARYTIDLAVGRRTPFEEAFSIDPDDLHTEINRFLLRGKHVTRTVKVEPSFDGFDVDALPEAKVHTTLAFLYAATPLPTLNDEARLERARLELDKARLAEPSNPEIDDVARLVARLQ